MTGHGNKQKIRKQTNKQKLWLSNMVISIMKIHKNLKDFEICFPRTRYESDKNMINIH